MSQDYTIFLNYRTQGQAELVARSMNLIGIYSEVQNDDGDDEQEYWQVMFDDVLSGTGRQPKDYYELKLKPFLAAAPLQVEFHILGTAGLVHMETITP